MARPRHPLISRFRRAISRVRFLMSFDLRRWLLLSSSIASKRRLSFGRQPQSPGLLDCTVSGYDASPTTARVSRSLSRAISGFSTESDDVDERAEVFIESFYRQLRMERQVSLDLRYCKGKDI